MGEELIEAALAHEDELEHQMLDESGLEHQGMEGGADPLLEILEQDVMPDMDDDEIQAQYQVFVSFLLLH